MLSIIDTQDSSSLLSHMPLYMDLLRGTRKRASQMALACIDHSFTNEMVRRIEELTGPCSERDDVFIAVQQLLFTCGRLGD